MNRIEDSLLERIVEVHPYAYGASPRITRTATASASAIAKHVHRREESRERHGRRDFESPEAWCGRVLRGQRIVAFRRAPHVLGPRLTSSARCCRTRQRLGRVRA